MAGPSALKGVRAGLLFYGDLMIANLENLSIAHDFPMQIEAIVRNKNIGYIEAIEQWCIINKKDILVGADLVKKSSVIKEKIKAEAEDLHFLPRSAKLPL